MKAEYHQSGLLIVVSGPSGVGKGTVCSALRKRLPNLAYSVSATTRQPRAGERDGVNYFFKTRAEFEHMIQNDELIEWAEYVGNYYGTPRGYVEDTLASGKDIVLEIEVQGAYQVKEAFPDGVFIFLVPPSMDDLRTRILHRGSETTSSLENRLGAAKDEYQHIHRYDYVVINDEVQKACDRVEAVLLAEHCRADRLVMSE
ncbi:guanylate kinase [Thermoactinomyces sp. DSM 45891]|uniref:guanylate kinase n=1 Tax=Thermoactinomyces sp. DSM 45891 TaxID=1761907 RepID=UPI00091FDA47|nr:guanylate kinase [Thermoactinomyces sp. DSM 45891]SFX51410.1 guanylate kinase [Thermoactinomyces sp. DSM 45891]